MNMDDLDLLESIGENSKLKETKQNQHETKAKYFKNMPLSYELRFKELKEKGAINGSFTAYCLNAIASSLTIDGV
ncbi:MAG: hypothetical protein KAH07_09870 [Flavobacteriaceae bacterium]|nr:hypothetical protein [Flavobacteriaceae bacterium]